jgi:hypothetical protein
MDASTGEHSLDVALVRPMFGALDGISQIVAAQGYPSHSCALKPTRPTNRLPVPPSNTLFGAML